MLLAAILSPRGNRRIPPALVAAAMLMFSDVLAAAPTGAGNLRPRQAPPATVVVSAAVPDPGNLGASWWDYLAPDQPGLGERSTTLLGAATAAAARLPPPELARAAVAIERLRSSLRTLNAMQSVKPARPPPAAALADSYTTSEFLRLDRHIRDLQSDVDERRAALDISLRALRDAERQLDGSFARYLQTPDGSPQKKALGLEIMAGRAQNAITQGEQHIRENERDALGAELADLREIRREAVLRIVPDPERSPVQLQNLIERTQEKLREQRQEILHLGAQRTALAGDPEGSATLAGLADQKIVAAMVDEANLVARGALYRTELDWLAVVTGEMTTLSVSGLEQRLAERTSLARELDSNALDWLAATERALATSLRTPAGGMAPEQARLREERISLAQQTITRIDQLRSVITDIRLGTDVTMQSLSRYSGWRGFVWTRVLNPLVGLVRETNELLATSLFKIGETPVTSYGLLRIGLFLLIAVVISRILRFALGRVSSRDRQRSAGLYAVGRLVHYLLIAAAILIGLTSIGLDFSQLALVAGALSIGIGFGLQSVVNNFVSGLIILFERNLKIGDVVQLDSGTTGVVREINMRSTLITTSDNVDIVVPNSEFIASKVTNYTLRDPFHRIHVPFTVAYGTDKELVRRLAVDAARRVPFTLTSEKDRDPDAWLVRLGANGLEFELVVWINPGAVSRPGAVMASYVWELESAFRDNGIEVPFPQRDVRVSWGQGGSQAPRNLTPPGA